MMEQQPTGRTEQPRAEPEIILPGAPVDFGSGVWRSTDSGARTHLCREVGADRQRRAIFAYRHSRGVRALSPPRHALISLAAIGMLAIGAIISTVWRGRSRRIG
jgi:hypothetical protein